MRVTAATLAIVVSAATGCDLGGAAEPLGPEDVTLLVNARVGSDAVATLVVEVYGPGIPATLVFNLPVVDQVAQGAVTVPSGANRTFTFHAFDGGGVETHRGSITVDVRPGSNPSVGVVLAPLAGQVPIDVQLGSVVITVVPGGDTLEIGNVVELKARVLDAEGKTVFEPVQWATLSPNVSTVISTSDSTGSVTARGPGQTLIVATLGGVGGSATIVVSPNPTLVEVVTGLSSPVYLTAVPGDTGRLFVVEQPGLIRVVKNGSLLSTPFLDIQSLVLCCGEQGLLSMAFHPDYSSNGFFYVDYTDLAGDTRVVRYSVSANPDLADPGTAQEILHVEQPFANHNGGLVMFGPDGFMYVGLGDGGSGGDPFEHGQDSTTLLGSILRLDVDAATPYGIPAGNPFAGHPSARPEIWAYGLRNPWRFSFDRLNDDLYVADVGQSAREEINYQLASSPRGENYGWNTMEGTACYDPPSACDPAGLRLPVHDYSHADGCSVTGGHVYRGSQLPAFLGRYFYSDYCNGWFKSFRMLSGVASDHRDHTSALGGPLGLVTSFGEDASGELYVITQEGKVFRLAAFN